ncbi:universal stress protein [soil metagenome]
MRQHTTLDNILFPTDFSDLAENALNTAIAMCKRHNAMLHLLHVVENQFLVAPSDVSISAVYVIPELEQSAEENMTALRDRIKMNHTITKLETYIEYGTAANAIRKKALEFNCDLIVMGTHGASGFREFFIGSNAYSLIKITTVPVLTVPGNKPVPDFKKILFPLRLSKGIREKYDFIAPIIEKNNAELIIAGLSNPGETFDKSFVEDEIKEVARALANNNTTYLVKYYECKNIARKVLELSEEADADLVVINASLDHNWSQFFIGPYAQQIVHHANVPVLSIRLTDHSSVIEDKGKDDDHQFLGS